MTSNLDIALAHARRSWRVIPCQPTKEPYWDPDDLKHGLDNATTDQAIIRRWWGRWQNALIGIACAKSRFFVVDVDVKHNQDGRRSWAELVNTLSGGVEVDIGPMQGTPSGGLHLFFKHPNFEIPSKVNALASGLDLRSNAYVCTGQGYTWEPGHDADQPLTEAPGWLLDRIKNLSKPAARAFTPPLETPPQDSANFWINYYLTKATPGNRNQAGFFLALQLRDSCFSEADALAAMRLFASRVPKGDEPYTTHEAEASLKSAYNRSRRPGNLPGIRSTPANETQPTPAPPPEPPDLQPEPPPAPARKTRYTVRELYATDFPEPTWIIPGIFPVGLVFLGGRPKVGKSWFLLQVAAGVATGGKLFDKDITQGKVLYLAYEDNPKRIKDRCQKMGIPDTDALEIEFTWKPLHKGGLDDLLIAIVQAHYALIVIDTLTRAIPGIDQNDQRVIAPIIDQLQRIALGHNMTIALADHTRKPGNGIFPDPIDDIMGSTAKAAAADAVLAIYKTQGKAGAQLQGRGKDIEDIDLALTFDVNTRCWQSRGSAASLEIIEYLEEEGKSQAAAIAKALGKDRGNTFKRLQDMAITGLIRKETIEGKTYYDLSP